MPPPTGVKVMGLCDASSLGHTVVKACREPRGHVASTLKRHRRLCQSGWRRKAGGYGRTLFRRRRPAPLVLTTPQGQTRDRCIDAGWLRVSHLGPRPVVCSRQGTARQILGLVSDAPALSAAGRMRTDAKRWAVEPCFKDRQQLLGLGPYQNRPDGTAVTPLPLVCFA